MNRREIIKNFTIGFFPLLLFVIADEIFGLTIGLIVAIVFGTGQFVFVLVKEKRIEKFILLDTVLILALGGISLVSHSELFIKIKPAIIELIMVLLLGLTVFGKSPILILMAQRHMKGMTIKEEQMERMKRSMIIMLLLFFLHVILIIYSAFYMSKSAWAFISGGLFYILIGVVFLFEFIRGRIERNRYLSKNASEEQTTDNSISKEK